MAIAATFPFITFRGLIIAGRIKGKNLHARVHADGTTVDPQMSRQMLNYMRVHAF